MSRGSPNFSSMSDKYIPKLIELNSYWQNAVEEAIQDTLKGEKRLYYALKNRKKIKQKLEKLGLKLKTPKIGGSFYPSRGKSYAMELQVHPKRSLISVGGEFSQMVSDPEKSRSRSRTRGETPQKFRNPERPLLGDGSLEKMKKSQNDFNYEAMGTCERIKMGGSVSDFGREEKEEEEEEEEEEEKEEEEEEEEEEMSVPEVKDPDCDYKKSNKKVEWIHVREISNFEDSNSEISEISKKEMNNNFTAMGCKEGNASKENKKIPINFDPRGDLFWENEVKNAIRANSNFEKRLQLALAKREILNEHQGILRLEEGDNQIEIKKSEAKNMDKKRRGKRFLSPFVRFYLDVYRELCLKCPMKEIGEEAAKRWWNMKMKQKFDTSAKKSRK